MAKDGDQPILTNDRPSSDISRDTQNFEEEDTLLHPNQSKPHSQRRHGWAFYRQMGLLAWAVFATALVVVLGVLYQRQRHTLSENAEVTGKRNLIFMVSDGMGPTSLSLTRSFRQTVSDLPFTDALFLDSHLIGSSRTRSSSSLITDSAAGATAFSCGFKSYNGAISVLPDHSPCGTVLEAAKRAGYMTGLVVTTRITDATPACFASHVQRRSYEDNIAEQMTGLTHPMGRVLDLMLGGGRCHFVPQGTPGSCREDDKDVIAQAQQDLGWHYMSNRSEFDALGSGQKAQLPLLGLFADTDIPYEVDRAQQSDIYPSLDEMARTALQILSEATKDSEKGFFLMIEGSRIDHAGHGNDPLAQVHEVLAYDKAFNSVVDFLKKDTTHGVLVGTSDHETGGLATARQLHDAYPVYRWFPDVLANATHSAEHLAYALEDHVSKHSTRSPADLPDSETESYIRHELIEKGLGIHDASDAEVDRLMEFTNPLLVSYLFADMISRRAQIGWTTHGHSAVDVNIYASSPTDAKALVGNHENTEVGDFLRDYLDLDVEAITKELNQPQSARVGGETWMGATTPAGSGGDDHYEGDFKKRGLACACGNEH